MPGRERRGSAQDIVRGEKGGGDGLRHVQADAVEKITGRGYEPGNCNAPSTTKIKISLRLLKSITAKSTALALARTLHTYHNYCQKQKQKRKGSEQEIKTVVPTLGAFSYNKSTPNVTTAKKKKKKKNTTK